MANAASRILRVMQKTNKDTISEIVYLKVKQKNPLIVNLEDRMDITEDFLIFDDTIIKERIEVGDILTATTFNDGQRYLISQGFKKELKPKIINNLDTDSEIDMLSAKQGKVLNDKIKQLESKIAELESKI